MIKLTINGQEKNWDGDPDLSDSAKKRRQTSNMPFHPDRQSRFQ